MTDTEKVQFLTAVLNTVRKETYQQLIERRIANALRRLEEEPTR